VRVDVDFHFATTSGQRWENHIPQGRPRASECG
jgi:hypothetical protein